MGPEKAAKWTPQRFNILVTGTPATGKSSLSSELALSIGLRHIDVGEFAKERNLLADHNAEQNFHYMHEDAVLDALEPIMTEGGVILDHHSCDWFPERWFQMVVVLRARTEDLYDRLMERGYSKGKVEENMQAEIMQVCRDEAVQSYPKARFVELDNSSEEKKVLNLASIHKEWAVLNGATEGNEIL